MVTGASLQSLARQYLLLPMVVGQPATVRPRAAGWHRAPDLAQACIFPDFWCAFGVSSMIEYTFVL